MLEPQSHNGLPVVNPLTALSIWSLCLDCSFQTLAACSFSSLCICWVWFVCCQNSPSCASKTFCSSCFSAWRLSRLSVAPFSIWSSISYRTFSRLRFCSWDLYAWRSDVSWGPNVVAVGCFDSTKSSSLRARSVIAWALISWRCLIFCLSLRSCSSSANFDSNYMLLWCRFRKSCCLLISSSWSCFLRIIAASIVRSKWVLFRKRRLGCTPFSTLRYGSERRGRSGRCGCVIIFDVYN